MIADVKDLLAARPFTPFTIYIADGREVRVLSPDHAHIHPTRARVVVYSEDGRTHFFPPLLMSGVTVDSENGQH